MNREVQVALRLMGKRVTCGECSHVKRSAFDKKHYCGDRCRRGRIYLIDTACSCFVPKVPEEESGS